MNSRTVKSNWCFPPLSARLSGVEQKKCAPFSFRTRTKRDIIEFGITKWQGHTHARRTLPYGDLEIVQFPRHPFTRRECNHSLWIVIHFRVCVWIVIEWMALFSGANEENTFNEIRNRHGHVNWPLSPKTRQSNFYKRRRGKSKSIVHNYWFNIPFGKRLIQSPMGFSMNRSESNRIESLAMPLPRFGQWFQICSSIFCHFRMFKIKARTRVNVLVCAPLPITITCHERFFFLAGQFSMICTLLQHSAILLLLSAFFFLILFEVRAHFCPVGRVRA